MPNWSAQFRPTTLYRTSRLATTSMYIASVILLVVFGSWQYHLINRDAESQMHRMSGQLQALYQSTISNKEKLSFTRVLRGQLEQLSIDGVTNQLRITDAEGEIVFEHYGKRLAGLPRNHKAIIRDRQGQQVATAEIAITIFRPIRKLFTVLLGAFMLLTMLYWLLIQKLHQRQQSLNASLAELIRVFENHQKSNATMKVATDDSRELLDLQKSVNQLGAYLQHTNDELDQQVRAASKEINQTLEELEIKNVELDLARKRAVESNEAKSSFLANISHEIRTPMHGIIGHLQLLQRQALSPQQEEYVTRTLEASNTLLDIIDDTLNLTRIEANKLDIQNLPFNLIEDINRCLIMQIPDAVKKNIDVFFLCDPDLEGSYVGDSLRVRQVFTNLLSNAIKYTDAGSIKVRLKRISRAGGSRDTIQLQVEDTGLGMDSSQIESLFEAFSQAGRSPESGTGLGLLITRTLTEAMGGKLQLESKPGKGSTFTVNLPLVPQPDHKAVPYVANIGGRVAVECQDEEIKRYYERLVSGAHLKVHSGQNNNVDVTLIILSQAQINALDEQGLELVAICQEREDVHLVLLNTLNLELMNRINLHSHCHSLPMTSDKLTIQTTLSRLITHQRHSGDITNSSQNIAPPVASKHQRERDNLEGIDILLADDDNFGRKYMSQLLREYGATVTTCKDGIETINKIKGNIYDLILLDIRMPNCDGIQATQEIRKISHAEETPIIGMTASVVPEQHQQCMQSGMTDYWTKPLQISQLMSGLRHWLDAKENIFLEETVKPSGISTELAIGQLDKEMREVLIRELEKARMYLGNFKLESSNRSELRELAHMLSGSAAICRLDNLRDSASKLQKNTRSKDGGGLPQRIQALQHDIEKVLACAGQI